MKRAKFTLAATLLLTCASSIASAEDIQVNAAPSTVSHPLQIGRHTTVGMTDADADRIIGDMSSILAQCTSQANRRGAVAVVNTPGTITSNADLNAACSSTFLPQEGGFEPLGVPRRVRIVNAINWCGSIGTSIIGCAPTPGTCLVMVRFTANQEGSLWAHEFGHSKGLPHRDVPNALMRPVIAAANRALTKQECASIRQLGFFELVSNDEPTPLNKIPITEFVTQTFAHGVPYAEARQYGSADLDEILPWLTAIDRRPYWSNIISVIGIVADGRSSGILRNHILRPATGSIDIDDYRSRVSAIISLGYVVYGNGDHDAKAFLESRKLPSDWTGTTWKAPYHARDEERDADLAAAAILGLGLTGDTAAYRSLLTAKDAFASNVKTPLLTSLAAAVDEAIKANQLVREEGMLSYTRQ
ncbi:matrixin family metalloprotease [Sinorhizobium medicae]|nr:matrixin family metalloprotease [Sinorhizobium medicae]MDX0506476.1 matrixin family metalloprotease [Sinorhizobium medicae]MDX0592903.1 matrixin family metalloprotease [Sinorhizobium medicae]MDX0648945.1 matrixin family metalloprotease [Sinorhizobium medicae]MDX0741786.1 matrixin family metalloprotease [Sinorhizobium medicae]